MNEKELLSILAERIRSRRKRLGLTIEMLSEVCGVGASFLGHIETKVKSPSLFTLAKIIDGLKVSPEELFRGKSKKTEPKSDPVDQRLQALIRSLKGREKAALVTILARLRDPRQQIKGLRLLLRV